MSARRRQRRRFIQPSAFDVLEVLADLMRGGAHSRTTVARGWRVSLPTADRWLKALEGVPGACKRKVSRTTWYEWRARLGPNGPVLSGELSARRARARPEP